jgi:flavin-dependent dehydrogenase
MAGDAAGMITPVCGNGMAIAIHAGKIVSYFAGEFASGRMTRLQMEEGYRRAWSKQFKTRLWFGRNVQRLFGDPAFSRMAVALARWSKPFAGMIVSKTHGRPF